MSRPEEQPPLRGDESELFESYADRLRHSITRAVNTTPENIEDACAFAWMQLFRKQPERETAFNWLWKVAWHEALRLDRLARRVDDLPEEHAVLQTRNDPASTVELRADALERLARLTDREREVFVLRGAGFTYEEAAQRLGISSTRLGGIIQRGAIRLASRSDEIEPPDPNERPRVRLLRELLRDPPPFVRAALGKPPSEHLRFTVRRNEWARLALAIVDYRVDSGISDPARPFGRDAPSTPRRSAIERAIASFEASRQTPGRGVER